MNPATKLKGRYEAREVLGEGGMGVVYRAFDTEVTREVAVKTVRESHDPQELELFRKECGVLAMLHHPNIVDLYDYGDFSEDGKSRPFFVMPLLPGVTLDKLIRDPSAQLTVQRVIDIITQTCRGLQAAHERGLVHRDIKASNIFVLDDDSVKLIDFGVVHLSGNRSRTGLMGTLSYMSPEQIEMNPPTAVSDIFSLAVVCYEALTRRRPFTGTSDDEIIRAILHLTPAPVSDLNPGVGLSLAQVIHAAMAKKPVHRTSTARQFAEELQMALHGQPIARFDPARQEPRMRRAQNALETSEYEFAAEILNELEAEGSFHPELRSLRKQVDQALRASALSKLLESARRRYEQEEYPLALQKIGEGLRIDPTHPELIALKAEVEGKQKSHQIENWLGLAEEHVRNFSYEHARAALNNVLELGPANTRAINMLSEVARLQDEYLQRKKEKEELYNLAVNHWQRGEVNSALSKLHRVLELDRKAPDPATSESVPPYQSFYNEVRSEHDAIDNSFADARKLLSEDDFAAASAICENYLGKYPGHALFQALKFDIGERQRQHMSAYVAKVDRDVAAEPDLERRVAILGEALKRYPGEAHFERALKVLSERRDLVNSIVQKAHNLEERGQIHEALSQLEILRTVYPQYPSLEFELERLAKRRNQHAAAEARSRYIEQVDRAIEAHDLAHAKKVLESALKDFPEDSEVLALEKLVWDTAERATAALIKLKEGQDLCAGGEFVRGLETLWEAHRLDEPNQAIRAVLADTLLKRAAAELDRDCDLSEKLIRQALTIQPGNVAARNLHKTVTARQKELAIDQFLASARNLQADGDAKAALSEIERALMAYPDDARLRSRRDSLLNAEEARLPLDRKNALEELQKLRRQLDANPNEDTRTSVVEYTQVLSRRYPNDDQIQKAVRETEEWNATMLFRGPKPEVNSAPAPATPPPDAGHAVTVEPSTSPDVPARPGSSRRLVFIGVAALLVLAALVAIPLFRKSEAPVVLSPDVPAAVPAEPAKASGADFVVRNGVPGTEVLVDDAPVGTVDPSGNLSVNVAPGPHRITMQLKNYETASFEMDFRPGESMSPTDEQVQLRALGWVDLNVTPPDADVTYRFGDDPAFRSAKNGERVWLNPGTYSFSVRAKNFEKITRSVNVTSGAGAEVRWALAPSGGPSASSSAAPQPDVAVKRVEIGPEGLMAQDGYTVFSEPALGTYQFQLKLKGGGLGGLVGGSRRASFVVNFVDRQNFIEYAIDDQNIRRTVVAKGRRTEEKPIPHGFGRPLNDEYRLSVRLETNTVEVSASTSSARVVQPTVVHGRFGFDREQTYTGFKFQGR